MTAQNILDTIVANLPLIITIAGATGLLGFVAGHIRRGVVEAKKAAARTPTKVDDFVVNVLAGPVLAGAELIERGDLEGAKRKAAEVKRIADDLKSGRPFSLPTGKR